ncbi:MAG: sulfite exporter TauE/SafE family protein, partial [Polyangiaceae bacterium]
VDAKRARAAAFRRSVAYNVGRVASYSVAGGFAGGVGSLLDRVPFFHGAQLGLRLFAGVVMVAVGVALFGTGGRLGILERVGAPLWKVVEPLAMRFIGRRSVASSLALGSLWGWMPCGLVYAALGLALGAGSVGGGALVMLAFGSGTAPMLLLMGTMAASLRRLMQSVYLRRAASVALVGWGVFHVANASVQILAPPTDHACCAHLPVASR